MDFLEDEYGAECINSFPLPEPHERNIPATDLRMTTGHHCYLTKDNVVISLRNVDSYKEESGRFKKVREGLSIVLASNTTPVRDLAEKIKVISPEEVSIYSFD